ncbi:MAG: choice-of-anchor D domain-containing protein, partial [Candidatus Marinimicrobia bacterium]|nr:choice-of-anchor D domain-containing protein [Candidatus Neomarinimicrobiota bacterium]
QSPSIDLRAIDGAMLAFEHFYNFDDCSDPTFNPDGGIVEISTDGGTSWTQLFPEDGYPYVLDDECSNPLAFYEAYSHDSDIFVPALFDLTLYVGNIINIRFHAGWDCGNCDSNEGWFIDDVMVFAGDVVWLSETPNTGTIAPGDSINIEIKVTTDILDGGTFVGNIIIKSNDPVTDSLVVPVNLTVTGIPDIAVTPDTLDFGQSFVGYPDSLALNIANVGTDLLTISNVTTDAAEFTVSSTSFSVIQGKDVDISVILTASTEGPVSGILTITSDDPDESAYTVTLMGDAIMPPIISLAPITLSDSLFTGDTSLQVLTISNDGGSDLVFDIEIEDLDSAFQTLQASSGRLMSAGSNQRFYSLPTFELSNNIKLSSLYAEEETNLPVMTAVQSGEFMKGIFSDLTTFRITTASGLWTIFYTQLISDLEERGAIVDTLAFGVDLTRDYLDEYDLLWVWDNRSYTTAELAVVTSWLSDGGAVLYEGDNLVMDLLPADADIQFTGETGFRSEFTTDIESHPTTTDVDTLFLGSVGNNLSVTGAGVVTVNDSLGVHAATVKYGSGQIYAIANEDFQDFSIVIAKNRLFGNQVFGWLASNVGWLGTDLQSGVIAANSSVDVTVRFDATDLFGGNYYANLIVNSNDPANLQSVVPTQLTVTGVPEINITATLLEFGKTFIGFPSSEFITITNQGTDTLKITDVLFDNPEYSTESTSIDILAGTDYDLKIDFTPTAAGFRFGVVTIRSNDADEDSISIALIGEGVPPPDIELSADSLFADLFTGEVDSQSVTISNVGLSDLTYEIFIVRDTTKESLASTQPMNNGNLRIKSTKSESGFRRNSLSSNTRPEIGFYADESRVGTGNLRQALTPATSTVLSDSDSALILNKFDNFVFGNTGIAWVNDTLYSISYLDSMLVSYDLATESITAEFPIRLESFGLAWDGTNLWIGNWNGNIYGYGLDGTEIGSFSAPFVNYPTLAWDGNYFIMSSLNDFMPTYYKVDVTGAVVDSFTSSFSVSPTQIAWVEEHNSLWLYDSDQIHLFQVELVDGTTNLLNEYVLFDSAGFDFAYSLTHDGTDLWWSDWDSQLHQVDDGIDEVGSWLTLNPSSGTIAAGASADIDVIFDAEGLFGGNYYVVLDFESNDPAAPLLNVSVHLKVTGAPDAVLSVDTLNFGTVFTMPFEDTLSVTLINRGTDTLKVSEITSDAVQINASPTSPFVLLPTEKELINIVIQSADPVSVSGTVTIHSNDPDEPLLLLHITAEVVAPPVISVSPDSLDDHLFSGDSSIHFLTIQNTGGSDLTFDITSMIVDIIAPVSSKANKFAEEADVGALRRLNIVESKVFTGRVKTEVVEKSRDSRGNVRAKLRPSVKSWNTKESSGTLFSTISSGKILGKIDKAAGKSYGPIENIDMSNWSQSSLPAAGEYQRSDFAERKKESLWERGTIGFDAPKVLLLANELPEFVDLAETALISTGLFVDSDIDTLIGPSLITLDDLTPFDAVLMWTNFNFVDPQNIGDVLKQYVDGGGGVILATYVYSTNWAIQGGILDADYSPFIPGTQQSVSGSLDLSSLQFPGHPIFANININPTYWSNSNYSNPSLNTGGILLAQDTFGNNVVAENSTGKVVGITVFPPILDANNFDTNDETRLMFANALYYVSNPKVSWLTANPQSATLPADSSLTIEVLFDANGLFGGDYYTELVFESNDPDPSRKDLTIPVHLRVTGVPDIFSDESSIDFGQVFVGYNAGRSLTIRNVGTDTLFIDNIGTNLSQL